MDIRAKVEARKAELQREAQEMAQRRLVSLDAGDTRIDEVSRAEAGFAVSTESHNRAQTAAFVQQVDAEFEKALDARASARWTNGETGFGCAFFVVSIGAFFVNWMLGLGLLFAAFCYLGITQSKHKRQLRVELARASET